MIKRILSAVKNILMYGSLDPYGSNWNSDWMESLPESEREKLTKKDKQCQKCLIAEAKSEVSLGHGSLKLRRMDKEVPEFSKILGFKCQWVIESDRDYQFVRYCPLCGKELK